MAFNPTQTSSFRPGDLGVASQSDQLDAAVEKLASSFAPLTTVVASVKSFGASLDGVRVPAVFAGTVFRTIGGESQALAKGIGKVNATFTDFTSGFTAAAQGLSQSVLLPITPLDALAQLIGPFVSAFNPAIMEQFGAVMTDLSAVVGSALAPVMAEVTEVVRGFADMLLQSEVPSALSEIVMTVVEAIKPLIPVSLQITQALQPFAQLFLNVLVPVIKFVAEVLQALIDVIHVVEQGLYDFVRAVMERVPDDQQRWRYRDFELEREVAKKAKENQSSTGMGVRNVSISTGGSALDSLRQKMATSALKIGGDETLKVARDQLATAKEQLNALNEIIRQRGGDEKATREQLTLRDYLGYKAEGFTDEQADLAAREKQRIRIDGTGRGREGRLAEIERSERARIAAKNQTDAFGKGGASLVVSSVDNLRSTLERLIGMDSQNGRRMANQDTAARV